SSLGKSASARCKRRVITVASFFHPSAPAGARSTAGPAPLPVASTRRRGFSASANFTRAGARTPAQACATIGIQAMHSQALTGNDAHSGAGVRRAENRFVIDRLGVRLPPVAIPYGASTYGAFRADASHPHHPQNS